MSLTETTEYDKIEVVGTYKAVQVRKANVIKKNGKEVARSFERYVLHPDADVSNQPVDIQKICSVVWTDAVKDAWKTFLSTSQKPMVVRKDDGEA